MGRVPCVAVQRLSPPHRPEILRHLLRLPPEDRRLRFGRAMQDAAADQMAFIDRLLKQQFLWVHAA